MRAAGRNAVLYVFARGRQNRHAIKKHSRADVACCYDISQMSEQAKSGYVRKRMNAVTGNLFACGSIERFHNANRSFYGTKPIFAVFRRGRDDSQSQWLRQDEHIAWLCFVVG